MNYQIELLQSFKLHYFPSGSSINYRDEKLFLIGDDANDILILNTNYQPVESHQLFNFSEKRIPKPVKPDLEASTFITLNGKDYLLILGSASTEKRKNIFLIPYSPIGLNILQTQSINVEAFINRLAEKGIEEINIEGVTVIGNYLVISNRSNQKNKTNHLIITEVDYWERQTEVNLNIVAIEIPTEIKECPGVSELCYVKENDILLIAFSSELTDNAYDDGAIGNSYVGCIRDISKKLLQPTLMIDQIVNLQHVHSDFKNEKIEGVCAESVLNHTLILHLISDNDLGESKLFKVKMTVHV